MIGLLPDLGNTRLPTFRAGFIEVAALVAGTGGIPLDRLLSALVAVWM